MKNKMHTLLKIGSAAALFVAAGSAVWSAVADAPKTPVAVADGSQIADQYKVLLKRSIFAKDGQPLPPKRFTPQSQPSRPNNGWPTPTTARAVLIPDAEASIVLKGVGMRDGVATAFFEQTSDAKLLSAQVGQSIARGKVTAISLDGVEYTLKEKPAKIAFGMALDGHVIDVPTATASTTSDRMSRWHRSGDTPGAATPAAYPQQGTFGAGNDNRRSGREGRDARGGGDYRSGDTRGGDTRGGDYRTDRRGPEAITPPGAPTTPAPTPATPTDPAAAPADPAAVPAAATVAPTEQPPARPADPDDVFNPFDFFDPDN